MVPSAMGAVGRDACPAMKGVLEGCRCRAAGFGEGTGSWHTQPPAANLHDQLYPPHLGQVGAGVMWVSVEQSLAKGRAVGRV